MNQVFKTFATAAVTCSVLVGCSSNPSNINKNVPQVKKPPTDQQIERSMRAQVALMLEAFTPIAGQALPNQSVVEAYKHRDYEPLWITKNAIDPTIYKLVERLEQSASHGLNPVHYHAGTIQQYLALKAPSAQQLAELDVIATIALSSYAHDLSIGRYEPQLIDPNWQLDAPNKDWKNLLFLDDAAAMVNQLSSIAPQHRQYQILQKWLVYYKELADKEGDIRIAAGEPLRRGDEGPRVAQLRARLIQLGDIRFSTRRVNEDYFDDDLRAALKRFQTRHDLHADGAAGPNTIRALNVSLATRAKQISYNLERWRWLPSQLEDNRIWVDLTDYTAEVHLDDNVETMNVVIGKPERKTNVFYGKMTYMVANPTWRVPMRIARENLLPKLQKNPNYLAKHGFQVYDSWSIGAKPLDPTTIDWKAIEPDDLSYRFEQAADDDNALGAYKFMFPNKYDIYLHDTPAKYLFRQKRRAYSSGCIRVEHPDELADLLVASDKKRTQELSQARQSRTTQVVSLPQALPVYLVYFTVMPDSSGMPEFREDVYDRDTLMSEAMDYVRFHPNSSL